MRIVSAVVVVVSLLGSAAGCACRGDGDRPGETANWTPVAPPSTRSESGKPSDPIRIESARYGRDEVWTDVTPQVRALVNGDTLVFPRDLQATFNVDPIPGRMKYVEMQLVVDGRFMEMTVGDSLHVTPLRIRAGGAGGETRKGGAGGKGGAGAGAAGERQ